jgi:hypothetical protein
MEGFCPGGGIDVGPISMTTPGSAFPVAVGRGTTVPAEKFPELGLKSGSLKPFASEPLL